MIPEEGYEIVCLRQCSSRASLTSLSLANFPFSLQSLSSPDISRISTEVKIEESVDTAHLGEDASRDSMCSGLRTWASQPEKSLFET